ncbi:MAG: hypothetical protein KDD15_24115, partial [Lewinella sp.]|nr:hypothetical protein [Lewinella sp.]
HDSSRGVLLKGDGKGDFTYVTPDQCGIRITGEVRDAWAFQQDGKIFMLVARNNDKSLLYQRQ